MSEDLKKEVQEAPLLWPLTPIPTFEEVYDPKICTEASREMATIGIGGGVHCDGQVLVVNDMLGTFERFTPKFVKRYASLSTEMRRAFSEYKDDVKSKTFPAPEHTVEMSDDEWQCLEEKLRTTSPSLIIHDQPVS